MSWKVVEINYKDEVFEINTNNEIQVGVVLKIRGVDYIIRSFTRVPNGYEDIRVETVEEYDKKARCICIKQGYYTLQEIEDMLTEIHGYKLSKIEVS